MGAASSMEGLLAHLHALPRGRRIVVAVAGAPGAGKSTFAERLGDGLNAREPGLAAVLPMDGYHYDDMLLEARGHRPRKGAPHTFDVDGLAAMLERLRRDDGRDIVVPVFDRSIEIARAGARVIGARTRIIIVEGNYLLLDDPDWARLADHFDRTVKLDVPLPVLEVRLRERWLGYGLDADALRAKLEANDLPNARLVIEKSRPADWTIANTGGSPPK